MAKTTKAGIFIQDTLTIRGKTIAVHSGTISQTKLRFFVENPRIYSIVRANGNSPTQEEIEKALQDMEHVRILKGDIHQNGGLIDPVIVKDGTFEVIEGNSRLAAYRLLAQADAIRWAEIKCRLLPSNFDESLISSLLGQYHLKGKTKWLPYEQAGFLHRRFKKQNASLKELAVEVGESQPKVKQYIDTYQFMIEHEDNIPERWSYYLEYLKSRKIQDAKKQHAGFEPLVVQMIKDEEFDSAQDFRDKMPVVCQAPKALKKFVAGKSTFEDAFDEAEQSGVSGDAYKKLNKFRKWLATEEAHQKIVGTKGPEHDKLKYEVDAIYNQIRKLVNKLKSGA